MRDKNQFALVPRVSGALEKSSPTAKRLLSQMVGETLALAKNKSALRSVFTVLLGDSTLEERYQSIIRSEVGPHTELKFLFFTTGEDLLKLARDHADLIVWNLGKFNALEPVVARALAVLSQVNAGGKIIVGSYGIEFTKGPGGSGVTFLFSHHTNDEFRWALREFLNPSDAFTRLRESGNQLSEIQRPRIVMMDDVLGVLESVGFLVQSYVKDATILTFTDAEFASLELKREEPDLFTTDISHPGISTETMLGDLSERNVRYPIFVLSSIAAQNEERLRRKCGADLKVSFWSKPPNPGLLGRSIVAALESRRVRHDER